MGELSNPDATVLYSSYNCDAEAAFPYRAFWYTAHDALTETSHDAFETSHKCSLILICAMDLPFYPGR